MGKIEILLILEKKKNIESAACVFFWEKVTAIHKFKMGKV